MQVRRLVSKNNYFTEGLQEGAEPAAEGESHTTPKRNLSVPNRVPHGGEEARGDTTRGDGELGVVRKRREEEGERDEETES